MGSFLKLGNYNSFSMYSFCPRFKVLIAMPPDINL
jgi:hypothetical protein